MTDSRRTQVGLLAVVAGLACTQAVVAASNCEQLASAGRLGATEIRDGRGVNTGLGVLSANRKALADPGKVAAIADFADRIERGYDWSRRERDGYLDFYAGFVKQDRALVDTLYDQEEAFKRVTIDDSFVATLQKTYDTWVEAGVLKGSRDIGANVYRDLPVAAATN